MKHAILSWALPLSALFVFGPMAGSVTGALRAVDGGPDATALVCTSPAMGVARYVVAFAIACLAGVLGAKLVNVRTGLMSCGLTLAWATWKTGTVDMLIRRAGDASPLKALAVEGAIVGVLGVIVATVICLAGGGDPHEDPDQADAEQDGFGRFIPTPIALGAVLVGTVVGGAGAWLVAFEPLKGQVFAAAVVAGLVTAAAGRIIQHRTPASAFFVGAMVLAIVGPISGAVAQSSTIVADMYAGNLMPLATPLPLDWVAGFFVGVPMGLGWAASMIEKRLEK